MPPICIAVAGVGAFGRNHLRVYREMETQYPTHIRLAAIIESDAITRAAAAAKWSVPAFASVAALVASGLPITAASVCVPTIHHASVAEDLLRAGIDVLIEKPFAATLAEADRVLALANANHRILQIGHLERFNPAVTATIERLNRPMFFEAHRLSIFTPRSLDVDVVLDLMIHDLDIVLALTNSPVREVRAVGLPILSSKVDIANVRIEFDSGCVANFTASRVSTEQVRKLRLFQPRQYISLDFARQELLSIDVDPTIPNPSTTAAGLAAAASLTSAAILGSTASGLSGASGHATSAFPAGFPPPPETPTPNPRSPRTWSSVTRNPSGIKHPSAGLHMDKVELPRAEPLRLELEDFLHSVRNRTTPRVPGEAALAALALALEINHQIATHSTRAGLT